MYSFGDYAKETLEQLSGKGAFLTVKKGDSTGAMKFSLRPCAQAATLLKC